MSKDYRGKNELSPEVKDLRAKIKQTGLSYRQVYIVTGASKGWWMRMVRGDFIEPNPENMKKANTFLADFIAVVGKYK